VVELRFAPGAHEDIALRLDGLVERLEVLPDRLLLYTDDGDSTLEGVHSRDIRPDASLVRRSTLEDVFLRLTGRSLVE
jgi:lipooligosaccharide transport system ATP-binding protein